VTTSANFQHYTGYPIQPTNVFSGPVLAQNSETVALEPAGKVRLLSINLLGLRISRPFSVWESRLTVEPLLDLLNIGNTHTVVSEVTSFGGSYLKPSDLLIPFIAKFGLRVKFRGCVGMAQPLLCEKNEAPDAICASVLSLRQN
jgi:hypothetical protein